MTAKASEHKYKALIERLQTQAREAPQAYRTRVALLAALGYAALGSILLVAVGLPLAIVVAVLVSGREFDPMLLLVLLPQAVFAAMVVRALWLRFDAPSGYRLVPGDAPALEAEIERLRLAAGAPPLEAVVIDSDLNAGAASMPRLLGLLGYRHYLVIGLPLMRLLDAAELSAVIAHEFGHFRGGHGRFSGWIYRVRLGWFRLVDGMARSGSAMARVFVKFFEWYAPYFNAYSFVLAREDEYEADAVSARVAGEAARVSALIRLEHASQWLLRRFLPKMQARMRSQPQPPAHYNALIAAALREAPPIDIPRLLVSATRENDLEDTHPTLPQRVAAVDAAATLRVQDTPAVSLLGDALSRIERALDGLWREEWKKPWVAAHAAAKADRDRLDALERRGEWTDAECLQHAQLVETARPDFEAAVLYDRVLERMPDSASAHVRAGVLRIDADEIAGVEHLRKAMTLDAGAIRPVFEKLRGYDRDGTIDPRIVDALAQLRAEFAERAKSLEARDGVAGDDALIAHDLDDAELDGLCAALARIEQVGQAWLARKRFDLAEEPAHYALLVTWRGSVASEGPGLKRIVAAWGLPGSVSVFTESEHKAEARRVRALCAEPVYQRGR
jgi:Zn-dependent protease with chaperone function